MKLDAHGTQKDTHNLFPHVRFFFLFGFFLLHFLFKLCFLVFFLSNFCFVVVLFTSFSKSVFLG